MSRSEIEQAVSVLLEASTNWEEKAIHALHKAARFSTVEITPEVEAEFTKELWIRMVELRRQVYVGKMEYGVFPGPMRPPRRVNPRQAEFMAAKLSRFSPAEFETFAGKFLRDYPSGLDKEDLAYPRRLGGVFDVDNEEEE